MCHNSFGQSAWITPTVISTTSWKRKLTPKHRTHQPQITISTPYACAPAQSPSTNLLKTIPKAPLLDALTHETTRIRANFFCPGHKQGALVHKALQDLLGKSVFKADLPELPVLDNLFAPEGVLAEAQQLASEAFTKTGPAVWNTYFLVNGTTCGVEAALLSCVRPNRHVILPRNAHQCAVHALVLTGAIPLWLDPVYDAHNDLLHGVTAKSVHDVLQAHRGTVDAVLIISPTYHGALSDISDIARISHAANARVIVDEAHGAHLAFHDSLPESATECDADIVLQSTHKTLPAFTQAAMMHVRHAEVNTRRVQAALQVVQSTSPNYLLLASLDATRALMQERGQELLTQTIQLSKQCAERISKIPGYSVLGLQTGSQGYGNSQIYAIDPTRLTVLLPRNVSGYDLDNHLIERFGVYAELPSFRHITFVLTVATTQEEIDTLVTSLRLYDATTNETMPFANGFNLFVPKFAHAIPQESYMAPRDAFFAPSVTVATEHAIGRVSAETLCPYPPGIPVVVPGEVITATSTQTLKAVLKAGGSVSGASDDTLSTIRVIDEAGEGESKMAD